MNTLDAPIKKSGEIIWQTVVKGGKKFTLQVYVRPEELARIVAKECDELQFTGSFDAGPLTFNLTRQL